MGAAIAQISGEYRDIATLSSDLTRDQLIEKSIKQATDNAIANGADRSTVRVIEKFVDPVPYVGEQGNVVVIYIKVVGDPQQDTAVTSQPTTTTSAEPSTVDERKDNPNWPYENEEVSKLDKIYGLPEPTIS